MANAYIVNSDGSTQQMTAVQCKNEEKELQTILEHNFQLLPGDQIEPEAPCRWMLVKKEMQVPDSNGTNRWAIDFFFVDQNGIPTFVECKRYADTRSRREVVGQVLEYAANAQYLWAKDVLREYAEQTAVARSTSIEDSLRALQIETPEAIDEFFGQVEAKLRNAEIRIVFFLEKAPEELKRLVEFLNTQMVSSDVLLVEARQYEATNGLRIVVPQLFGFTERARQLKQYSKVEGTQQPGTEWNWERLRDDAIQRGTDSSAIAAMRHVIDECQGLGFVCRWGRGKQVGALNVECPVAPPSLFLSVTSDGRLWFNLGNLSTPEAIPFRDRLKNAIVSDLGLKVKDDYQNRYPNYAVEEWGPKVAKVVAILKEFAPRASAASA